MTGLSATAGIALDLLADKMYWADAGTNKLQRADLDGSNLEDVIGTGGNPVGIALNASLQAVSFP